MTKYIIYLALSFNILLNWYIFTHLKLPDTWNFKYTYFLAFQWINEENLNWVVLPTPRKGGLRIISKSRLFEICQYVGFPS